MKVSVIVPNHGRDISILKKSLPKDIELVEINRGFERSKQRNIGIKEATGEMLLFLDSDQSISAGLVAECVQFLNEGHSCVYIPEIIVARSVFGRVRAFEREFYTGTAIDVPRFIWKDQCPEFDETLHGPEDSDWGNRIYGFRAVSKNPVYHHDDISFFEYCRKKSYYSKSMKRYSEKWPKDKCLNLKYRCWTVFVENGKWKKMVRHPFLSLGIFLILIVRGVIYATNR